MGGGGGPSITYVYVNQEEIKKAIAYCLDDKNCTGDVGGAQKNGYIGDGIPACGYLDKTARKLIKHAGCESFENKVVSGEGFTSFIDNLQKKEDKEEQENENRYIQKISKQINKNKNK